MTESALKAALYLEGVLPVLPLLQKHDPQLAALIGACPDVAVHLSVTNGPSAGLSVLVGRIHYEPARLSGAMTLWFPTSGQLVRAFDGKGRLAIALPIRGFRHLKHAAALQPVARRLEQILNTRAPAHTQLHAWGNLAAGLFGAIVWLRRAHGGPQSRRLWARGTVVFTCPEFPEPLWLDLDNLTAGTGTPASAPTAEVTFADIATLLAELDGQLDSPAALGLGTLRIRGHLPLVENLGILMQDLGKLLKP